MDWENNDVKAFFVESNGEHAALFRLAIVITNRVQVLMDHRATITTMTIVTLMGTRRMVGTKVETPAQPLER